MSYESKYTQIVDAVIARFQSIRGDNGVTYWSTPDRVIRHYALTQSCLDATVGEPATIYVVSPGPEEIQASTMGPTGQYRAAMTLDVTVAQRFKGGSNPFKPADPDRGTVQDRLIRDALKALHKDQADGSASPFGGLAISVATDAPDRTEENTYFEPWVLAFIPVQIIYQYPVSTP